MLFHRSRNVNKHFGLQFPSKCVKVKIVIFAEKKQINLKFTFEKRKMESKSEVLSALKPGPVILKWINALMRFDAFYAPLKA